MILPQKRSKRTQITSAAIVFLSKITSHLCLFDRIVTAGKERITSQNPLDGHIAAFESAVFSDGIEAVLGAGGVITALDKEPGDRA